MEFLIFLKMELRACREPGNKENLSEKIIWGLDYTEVVAKMKNVGRNRHMLVTCGI